MIATGNHNKDSLRSATPFQGAAGTSCQWVARLATSTSPILLKMCSHIFSSYNRRAAAAHFLDKRTKLAYHIFVKARVPSAPVGRWGRIDNPVQLRNGTATVSAEAGSKTKVSHWGYPREGALRRGCTSQETCSGLPPFPGKWKSGTYACGNSAAAVLCWAAAFLLGGIMATPRFMLAGQSSGCGKTTFTRLLNGLAPAFFPGRSGGALHGCASHRCGRNDCKGHRFEESIHRSVEIFGFTINPAVKLGNISRRDQSTNNQASNGFIRVRHPKRRRVCPGSREPPVRT